MTPNAGTVLPKMTPNAELAYAWLKSKTLGPSVLKHAEAVQWGEHKVVLAPVGKTVRQCLALKWPILVATPDFREYLGPNKYEAYLGGVSMRVFEDANDVAGLSEYFANMGKAKV